MNRLCKTGFLALLTMNSMAYALHPVQGWYGGIMLGFNYTPSTNFTLPTPTPPLIAEGALNYGTMGQIGGEFGYRCGKYRFEGNYFYNNSPYKSLEVNGSTIFAPSINTTGYRIEGSTDTGAVMFNGFYDFFSSDLSSNLVPYLGGGIGYAYASNNFKIYNQEIVYDQASLKAHTTSPAGQAIVGASYFLDDFTFFGLDFRYFTTSANSKLLDARVQVYSLNLSFNGAFNIA